MATVRLESPSKRRASNTSTMAIIDEYDEVQLTSSNLAELPREIVFKIVASMNLSICSMVTTFPSSWYDTMTHPLFLIHENSRRHHPHRPLISLIVRDPAVMLNEFILVQEDISLGKFFSTKPKLVLPEGIYNWQLNPIHGLICFWRFLYDDLVYLCNPLTAEWVRLPHPEPAPSDEGVFSGFGYSPSTNQYKVVRIAVHWGWGNNSFYVDVYTIGTSRWRRIEVEDNERMFGQIRKKCYWAPVLVNGVLHWLYNNSDAGNHSYNVLCFDVETGKLDSFQLPNPEGDLVELIGELNGSLTMYKDSRSEFGCMSMWVLQDYSKKNSWVKLGEYYKGSYSVDEIIHHVVDNEEKKVLMVQGRFLSYSFEAKTERLENIYEVDTLAYRPIRWFVPSFLSPRQMMQLDH